MANITTCLATSPKPTGSSKAWKCGTGAGAVGCLRGPQNMIEGRWLSEVGWKNGKKNGNRADARGNSGHKAPSHDASTSRREPGQWQRWRGAQPSAAIIPRRCIVGGGLALVALVVVAIAATLIAASAASAGMLDPHLHLHDLVRARLVRRLCIRRCFPEDWLLRYRTDRSRGGGFQGDSPPKRTNRAS